MVKQLIELEVNDHLKVSIRPDLSKKIQKKFISKSTLKSTFKIDNLFHIQKYSVQGCFGIYIYNCIYVQNNSAQNCLGMFGILCSSCMDLHLFEELSV